MTNKNLVVLGAAAVVLAGAAWWCNSGRKMHTPSLTGKMVLPAFDMGDVARIEIGNKKVALVAKDSGWQVESLYGYPADITKIRENVLKLKELKVGQVANGRKITTPTLIDLQNAQGKSIVALAMGDTHKSKPRGQMAMYGGGAMPDGRYVSMGDKVVLVNDTLDAFDGDPKKWVDARIAAVPSADVTQVYYAQGANRVKLTRKDGAWNLEGLGAKEELDSSKTYSLDSGLSYLDFTDVVDPKKTSAECGFTTGGVYTVTLKNGISYVAEIGAAAANGRYFKVAASFAAKGTNAVENSACEKQVKDFNAAKGKWTYLISTYSADAMLKTRKDLVKAKEEPKKEDKKEATTSVKK